jgi:hypothetical protein
MSLFRTDVCLLNNPVSIVVAVLILIGLASIVHGTDSIFGMIEIPVQTELCWAHQSWH